jgi:hypothetical protein
MMPRGATIGNRLSVGHGAPLGNQNARKAKRWENAIKRALGKMGNDNLSAGLDRLADKVVTMALEGDPWAITEIGNRIDGKPRQQVEINGEFRHRDVSSEPLSADEWEQTYGHRVEAAAGAAEVVN